MLQEFPAEGVVIPVKKPTPTLEGFVSEAGQPPSQRVWSEATPAPARLHGQLLGSAVEQLRVPQQPKRWLLDVGAPAIALLVPAAIVLVVIVSTRPSPATALRPAGGRGTDIALPAASVRSAPEIPTLPVRFQTVSSPASAPKAVSRPQPVDTPPPPPQVRLKPDTTRVTPPVRLIPAATGVSTPRPSYERVELPIAQPAPPVIPQASPVISAAGTNANLEARVVMPQPEPLQAMATPVNTVNTIADEQPAILAAINRYQAAYENLDATAAKKVWPAVNERALAKAFGELESQTLTFEPCQIDVTGTRARASCPGYARYVGRVGKTRNEQRRDWTFVLQKSNESWHIDAVQSR